mgnify:CR=1 FL=1
MESPEENVHEKELSVDEETGAVLGAQETKEMKKKKTENPEAWREQK